MIGKFDRHCPKCGAGISRYNADPFCKPCKAEPGFVWHWSEFLAEWVLLPVLRLEPEWEPRPGDVLLGEAFGPAPRRKVDNWDKWRKGESALV